MSAKWTWVFGLATAFSLVLGFYLFGVTQNVTGRDWAAVGIGVLIGGFIAALISTFLFHKVGEIQAPAETPVEGIAAIEVRDSAKLEPFQTREDRIREIKLHIDEYEMLATNAGKNALKLRADAGRSRRMGADESVSAELALAEIWMARHQSAVDNLTVLEKEIARLQSLTNGEFEMEQSQSLRGS